MNFEELCFEMYWKRIDKKKAKELIDKLYKESSHLRKLGKDEEANVMMYKANRLENVNSELYGKKPFQGGDEMDLPRRTDYYNFGKF